MCSAHITLEPVLKLPLARCSTEFPYRISASTLAAVLRRPEKYPYTKILVIDARSAVDFVTEHRLATIFEGIDFMRLNLMTDLARKGAALLDLRMPDTQDVSDIPDYPMLQLIVFCSPEQEAGLIARMPSCETTRWTPLLCDVMPRGGGKHVGIRKTLDYYGFSREESMAFGDGENDISMLQYVGLGVAMGNADAEVKAAADYVTTGTDDGGIAKALRRFGLISG